MSRPIKLCDNRSIFHSTDQIYNPIKFPDNPLKKHYFHPNMKEISQNFEKSNNLLFSNSITINNTQHSRNNSNIIEKSTSKKPLEVRFRINRMPPLPTNSEKSFKIAKKIMNINENATNERKISNNSNEIAKFNEKRPVSLRLNDFDKNMIKPIKENLIKQNSIHTSSSISVIDSIKKTAISHIIVRPKTLIPKVKAKSWVVVDQNTEKTLFSKKPRKLREIASLTKIMTCYLACFYIEKYQINTDNYFMKVPKSAVLIGGTTAELEHGDFISIKQLLYGMMLPSGNDAAYCLANFFGKLAFILYQEEKSNGVRVKNPKFTDIYREKWNEEYPIKDFVKCFVNEMNKTARNLGLFNTYFRNPHGRSDKINKSTAEDMAKLSILSLKMRFFKEIINKKEYICNIQTKRKENKEMIWKNTNELLDKGFNGIKTGNTPSAGPCFATNFNQNGLNLIIIILKSKSEDSRFGDAVKLSKWLVKARIG